MFMYMYMTMYHKHQDKNGSKIIEFYMEIGCIPSNFRLKHLMLIKIYNIPVKTGNQHAVMNGGKRLFCCLDDWDSQSVKLTELQG